MRKSPQKTVKRQNGEKICKKIDGLVQEVQSTRRIRRISQKEEYQRSISIASSVRHDFLN